MDGQRDKAFSADGILANPIEESGDLQNTYSESDFGTVSTSNGKYIVLG